MLIDRLLVERIYLRRLGHSPRGADLFGHLLELGPGAASEKDLCPSRAKARATAPPIEPPPP
jgi:hypothetical protein